MQYKRIPHTRLSPSTICLGTALFGTDEDQVLVYNNEELLPRPVHSDREII